MIRSMKNTFHDFTFYESTFDTETGTLVRLMEEPDRDEYGRRDYWAFERMVLDACTDGDISHDRVLQNEWKDKFGFRRAAFSPSPETIDISITDWCDFGCSYCYQDSTAKQKHADKNLVTQVIKNFDIAPYQIAIGGGEPCAHPDLPEILYSARELGVVPNYTTAGHILRDDVIEATNKACGGVSMTYHSWRGIDWFREHYSKLRQRLTTKVNVHLIADKHVGENLTHLTNLQDKVGPLSIILLAYYPNVGRGNLHGVMPKRVYMELLPQAIKYATARGVTLAFSEGLLPYFLSRPNLLETKYATPSEGRFSCYVDPRGYMSRSSFDPPAKINTITDSNTDLLAQIKWSHGDGTKSAWQNGLQLCWNKISEYIASEPRGIACEHCEVSQQCVVPTRHHMLVCAYQKHNL